MAYELIDEGPAPAAGGKYELLPDAPAAAPAAKPKPIRANKTPLIGPLLDRFGVNLDVQDVAPAMASGMASIGDSLLGAGTALLPKPVRDWNADRAASLKAFNDERIDLPTFAATKFITEAGATAPIGGVLGKGVRMIPGAAPLADAITSGGFTTGRTATPLIGRTARAVELAKDTGLRAAGGSIAAGAQTALIAPDQAGTGALIGAFLPPALRGAERLGTGTAQGVRGFLRPQTARDAETVLRAGGYGADDVPAIRAALDDRGPRLVDPMRADPRAGPTSAELLYNPERPDLAQMERTLRNTPKAAGPFVAGDAARNAARLATVEGVAPTASDLAAARSNFGAETVRQARAADTAARKHTTAAFETVDPFNESGLLLPIDEMGAARSRYLGPGTFGTGERAAQAVRAAEEMGTETLPAITAAKVPVRQGEDLVTALRSLGGIKQDSPGGMAFKGELYDLKQSPGMRAVMQNGRGQSPDVLAQAMHARGFIADEDPATLLNALREHAAGNKVFAAASERRGAMRAGVEGAMGDAPAAETVRKVVPFDQVQDLRASIGEAWKKATLEGSAKEAAALKAMQGEIDAATARVARGDGQPNEVFTQDMADRYREALARHADRKDRFARGPQKGIFTRDKAGDFTTEPGELAPKFFNSSAGQVEDVAALHRMRLGDEVPDLLKSYATTDLVGSGSDAMGNLTNAKTNRWLDGRAGAIRSLFSESEGARLSGVGTDLRRQAEAEALGKTKAGSTTDQNLRAALGAGLLDSPFLAGAVEKVPLIGRSMLRPALGGAQSLVKNNKAERLAALMADPVELEKALAAYERTSGAGRPISLGTGSTIGRLGYRALPLLSTGQL